MNTEIFHLVSFLVNRSFPPVEKSGNCEIRKALTLKLFPLWLSVKSRVFDSSVARGKGSRLDARKAATGLGEGGEDTMAAGVG